MEPKALKAISIAILIMVLWNVYYYYRYKDVIEQNRIEQAEKSEEIKQAEKEGGRPFTKEEIARREKPAEITGLDQVDDGAPAPVVAFDSLAGTDAQEIIVDTGVARITLSNIGAVITSLQLMEYLNEDGEPSEIVDREGDKKPLSIEFATPEASRRINTTVFASSVEGDIKLGPQNPHRSVTYTFALENGFRLEKKLTFHHNSYIFDLEIGLKQPGSSVTGSTFGLTWPGLGKDTYSDYSYKGPVILVDGKRLADQPDEDEKETYEGEILWTGLTSKYYCALFLPESKTGKATKRFIKDDTYSSTLQLFSQIDGSNTRLSLYVGPKKQDELAAQGRQLDRLINYGWFDILAKPLFWMLIWFYGFTGNFGWAIIILTVLIKILFFPLSQKSFKSMAKMKKLQPQMKIIQERYKNNKTKLNEELIALYRNNKVNPLSGCMPMLLQIPVFIALYKVLLESIELKGAPFMLWLTDLSAKDPYYITPILMGASMFLQQKLSPAATDPIQRNLMLMMPAIFTVMFLNFPCGLVIYWLINNLLSIAQQYYISRQPTLAR